jgi:hypothetical protein
VKKRKKKNYFFLLLLLQLGNLKRWAFWWN